MTLVLYSLEALPGTEISRERVWRGTVVKTHVCPWHSEETHTNFLFHFKSTAWPYFCPKAKTKGLCDQSLSLKQHNYSGSLFIKCKWLDWIPLGMKLWKAQRWWIQMLTLPCISLWLTWPSRISALSSAKPDRHQPLTSLSAWSVTSTE